MRTIHRSQYRDSSGHLLFGAGLQLAFERGGQTRRQMEGEDRVAAALAHVLDDQYTVIRNVVIPGDRYDLDMVVVGPTGVVEIEVLQLTRLVRGEQGWLSWDFNQNGLRLVPAELGQRAQEKIVRLANFLAQQGAPRLDINQVVVISNPEAPREFTRPGLQIVFMDELEGFMQTVLEVLRSPTPMPAKRIIEVLSLVKGHETGLIVPKTYWGMTPGQFFLILLFIVGDICLLLAGVYLVLVYNNPLGP